MLSDSLSRINETAHSPIMDDIVDSIMSLEENDFILTTDEYIVESSKNYHIHRLSAFISQLQQDQHEK